jgi:hypothetical protein
MWNNAMYETEKRRVAEKRAIERNNFIMGLILAPVYLLGWFPILWILSKLFDK